MSGYKSTHKSGDQEILLAKASREHFPKLVVFTNADRLEVINQPYSAVDLHRPMGGIFHLRVDGCVGVLLHQHTRLAQLRETKGGEHANWPAAYDQDLRLERDVNVGGTHSSIDIQYFLSEE